MKLSIINNFFDPNDVITVNSAVLEGARWSFTGRSNENSDPSFWYYEMYDLDDLKELFILKAHENNIKIVKINAFYANGQSHGQCGSFHQDSKSHHDYTLIYYANNEWDPSWGGATIFRDERNLVTTIYPEFNKAILFKSNIFHCGLEPTIFFKGLRTTVALKFSI
jgi:Rps23 Pro-64 3,4-dihydroxylase Tpa1-like proline 4-hydroxylase